MSVNVYVKEEVENQEGFEAVERSGGKPTQRWHDHYFKGLSIHREHGWHFSLQELTDQIPEFIREFVTHLTFRDNIPTRPSRKLGVYKHGDSEAELDISPYSHGENYELKMCGKDLAEMLTLYRGIRAGTLQPTQSWEGEQTGSTDDSSSHQSEQRNSFEDPDDDPGDEDLLHEVEDENEDDEEDDPQSD